MTLDKSPPWHGLSFSLCKPPYQYLPPLSRLLLQCHHYHTSRILMGMAIHLPCLLPTDCRPFGWSPSGFISQLDQPNLPITVLLWAALDTHACHTGEYCWNKSHIPTARLHSEVMTIGLQWALHAAPRASASCLLSFQIAAPCHSPPSQEMTLPQTSLKEHVPRAVTVFPLLPPPCGPVVHSARPWWLRPDTQRPHALPFQRPVLRLVLWVVFLLTLPGT